MSTLLGVRPDAGPCRQGDSPVSFLPRHHPDRLLARIRRHLRQGREAGVGLDLSANDLHEQAKQQDPPWTLCKGFDTAAPLSAFIEAARVPDPQHARFRLDVNGTPRQHGDAGEMVFGIARIVSYLSQAFRLQPGNIIYTGTPAGAGPLARGDRLQLDYNDGQVRAEFRVA